MTLNNVITLQKKKLIILYIYFLMSEICKEKKKEIKVEKEKY